MQYSTLGQSVLAVLVLLGSAHADVPSLTDIVLSTSNVERLPEPKQMMPPPPAPSAEDVLGERVRAGRAWRIETVRGPVHVWIPQNYDPATAATVVFVHGYWTEVDDAWADYRLPMQFALSGINAMFVAPGAPSAKWEPLVWPSLTELLRTVKDNVDVEMPSKRLVAAGHSGAYRTLAVWLGNQSLDTVVLLDAVYQEYSFMPWVKENKDRRLVNIVYETGRFSDYMHRRLPSTKRVEGLPREGFPDAHILYAKTYAGHWELVTDGVALPLALRAIAVPRVEGAPTDLPLGLPLRCDPPVANPFAPRIADTER